MLKKIKSYFCKHKNTKIEHNYGYHKVFNSSFFGCLVLENCVKCNKTITVKDFIREEEGETSKKD